jgi:hypothetical protein
MTNLFVASAGMKTLFEKYKGKKVIVAFDWQLRIEGVVLQVSDEWALLDVGAQEMQTKFAYVQFSKIAAVYAEAAAG